MSIKLGMNSAQEILVMALMIVFVFAVLYSDMEFMYKVGIAVLVFSVIFLASLANQILKQDKEKRRL